MNDGEDLQTRLAERRERNQGLKLSPYLDTSSLEKEGRTPWLSAGDRSTRSARWGDEGGAGASERALRSVFLDHQDSLTLCCPVHPGEGGVGQQGIGDYRIVVDFSSVARSKRIGLDIRRNARRTYLHTT